MKRDCPPHRWRIESPNGEPMLEGRCVHCKAHRKFPAVERPYEQRDKRQNAAIFNRPVKP